MPIKKHAHTHTQNIINFPRQTENEEKKRNICPSVAFAYYEKKQISNSFDFIAPPPIGTCTRTIKRRTGQPVALEVTEQQCSWGYKEMEKNRRDDFVFSISSNGTKGYIFKNFFLFMRVCVSCFLFCRIFSKVPAAVYRMQQMFVFSAAYNCYCFHFFVAGSKWLGSSDEFG